MTTPLLILYGSQTGNAQARFLPPCACPCHERSIMHLLAPLQISNRQRCVRLSSCIDCAFMVASQDVAERIGREAAVRHFRPHIAAMDEYSIAQLPTNRLVVFVASTTGQACRSLLNMTLGVYT